MTLEELKAKVKTFLDIEDTDIYDTKLDIYISSSIQKLEISGVSSVLDDTTISENINNMYSVCVAIDVSKLMDIDINSDRLNRLYLTNVNMLRNYNV